MEFTVDLPDLKNASIVNADDFGMNVMSEDNTLALNSAIDHCKQFTSSILEIKNGIYKFNNKVTININGLSNFCFNGNGSEFIFSDLGHFRSNGCDHILLKDIIVDWDWEKERLASLIKVISITGNSDADDRCIELEFPELKTVDTDIVFYQMNQYDSVTLTPGTENGQELYWNKMVAKKVEKGVKANYLKIYPEKESFPGLSVGDVFLVRHTTRRGAAFIATDCSHLTYNNIKIYSGPGGCFVVTGESHHIKLDACTIGIRPGSGRHMSADADGYHIVQSKGYHIIENCDFSYMGDDDVNIHDCIGFVFSRIDDHHIQMENAISGIPGDVLEVRGPDFSDMGITLELTENKFVDQKSILTIKEVIPPFIGETYLLKNLRYNSSHYIIRNNHFHHNRARGLLLQCSDGLVENNRFTGIQGAAIYVMMETLRGHWYEGVGVDHLVIRNNIFENCNVNDWTSVIDLMAIIPDRKSDYPVFTDITIENNTFDEFPSGVIFINKSKNVRITGNRFKSTKERKTNKDNRGHFYVSHSADVVIEDNIWEPSPLMKTPGFIHTDGKSDGGLYRVSCDELEETGKLSI
ncbi:MAG: right-handed parallel beta-helix repeat-containing protein [Saccharofermentanales bacterium]